jgi:hypothetical protein
MIDLFQTRLTRLGPDGDLGKLVCCFDQSWHLQTKELHKDESLTSLGFVFSVKRGGKLRHLH